MAINRPQLALFFVLGNSSKVFSASSTLALKSLASNNLLFSGFKSFSKDLLSFRFFKAFFAGLFSFIIIVFKSTVSNQFAKIEIGFLACKC